MIKILFVCLGNICRSPMAEFIFKDIVKKNDVEKEFYIESAGTSNEEIGNPVYYGTKNKLASVGISTDGKYARQMNKSDYDKFNYIIAMEEYNIEKIKKIIGNDTKNKVYRLLDFSSNPRDIADPWYTHNFDLAYEEILEGCMCLFNKLV